MTEIIHIDGESLTPLAFDRVTRIGWTVEVAPHCRASIERAARYVAELAAGESTVYGINTGFGEFVNVRISPEDVRRIQENLILSHAVGVDRPLEQETVRGLVLLRSNSLCRGYSGVRGDVIDRLIAFLNRDLLPVVPSRGSVGASGDLAPLAYIGLGLIGRGEFHFQGRSISAAEAHEILGDPPLILQAKEGLALINGTQLMVALGLGVLGRAERLLKSGQIAAAMAVEAYEGSHRPFMDRVQALRPHRGQIRVAGNFRRLLEGSEIVEAHADCDRVQDPYTFRCIPQVMGATLDVLSKALDVLELEANSVTDNPLVFAEEGEVVSGGNFHGQPIAFALDTISMALTDIGSFSERRTEKLLHSSNPKLPKCLVENGGLNTGLMITQYTAAALVNECKVLAYPSSVDSIPTSGGVEDHVSMGATSGLKLQRIADHLESIMAIELLCAAQALDFHKGVRPGRGVEIAQEFVRSRVDHLDGDRELGQDLRTLGSMVRSGEMVTAVENEIGLLEGLRGEERIVDAS